MSNRKDGSWFPGQNMGLRGIGMANSDSGRHNLLCASYALEFIVWLQR